MTLARFFTVLYPLGGVDSVACKGVIWGVQYFVGFGGGSSRDGTAHEFRGHIAGRRRPDSGGAGRRPSECTVSEYAPVPELSQVYRRAHSRRGKRSSSRTGHRGRSI